MGSYSLNIFLMLLLLYPWMGNKVCSFKDVHKLLKPTVWKHCLFIICASKGDIWMTYVRWWMIVNCAMIKSWSYFKVKQLCITAALTAVREWFLLISILLKVLKSKLATRSCQWKELEMIQLYFFSLTLFPVCSFKSKPYLPQWQKCKVIICCTYQVQSILHLCFCLNVNHNWVNAHSLMF